jgi:hypothetical protein
MTPKPKVTNSLAEQEMDKVETQFKAFEENVSELTMDRMKLVPKLAEEPQTKISQADIDKQNGRYLKPYRAIGSQEKFNEKFRKEYEMEKQYENIIAENKEIFGEAIDMWSKPFPGCPVEWWKIPVNTPIWVPKYISDQLKRKYYHRLEMKEQTTGSEGPAQYYGRMVVDTTIPRLNAYSVGNRRSVFMGI